MVEGVNRYSRPPTKISHTRNTVRRDRNRDARLEHVGVRPLGQGSGTAGGVCECGSGTSRSGCTPSRSCATTCFWMQDESDRLRWLGCVVSWFGSVGESIGVRREGSPSQLGDLKSIASSQTTSARAQDSGVLEREL
jgi:hypothetical protein